MQSLAQSLHFAGTHARVGSAESILGHIQRLMDSRMGQSLASPGYGLSISRCAMRDALCLLPKSLHLIERSVLQALQDNETRLQHWRLRRPSLFNHRALILYVAASRRHEPYEVMHFDLEISPLGRVVVRS